MVITTSYYTSSVDPTYGGTTYNIYGKYNDPVTTYLPGILPDIANQYVSRKTLEDNVSPPFKVAARSYEQHSVQGLAILDKANTGLPSTFLYSITCFKELQYDPMVGIVQVNNTINFYADVSIVSTSSVMYPTLPLAKNDSVVIGFVLTDSIKSIIQSLTGWSCIGFTNHGLVFSDSEFISENRMPLHQQTYGIIPKSAPSDYDVLNLTQIPYTDTFGEKWTTGFKRQSNGKWAANNRVLLGLKQGSFGAQAQMFVLPNANTTASWYVEYYDCMGVIVSTATGTVPVTFYTADYPTFGVYVGYCSVPFTLPAGAHGVLEATAYVIFTDGDGYQWAGQKYFSSRINMNPWTSTQGDGMPAQLHSQP